MDEMLIRFSCGNCGQRYKAEESFAGEKIECRKCGKDVPVPDLPRKVPLLEGIKLPKLTLSRSTGEKLNQTIERPNRLQV
ncbi:MAG: hypothetical protein PHV82_13415 [Victivallaceae bacterium]|nr:hypothetical protein [Victivallaceae bacterium]